MNMKTHFLVFASMLIILCSCDHFLDIKPDQSIAIPENLSDVRAILDQQSEINDNFPGLMDLAGDDYFVDFTTWQSKPVDDQMLYIWDGSATTEDPLTWNESYGAILIANVALESLDILESDGEDRSAINELRGEAYFIRAIRLYHLSQLFCRPYASGTANDGPGLPLRESSDLNATSFRVTVEQTYQYILENLSKAISFLPKKSASITRPGLDAAYGLQAKVYLSMQNYEKALTAAEQSLKIHPDLLDYNELDPSPSIPFTLNNKELIYYAHNVSAGRLITQTLANVDTLLYDLFEEDDLRKKLFFEPKNNGYMAFRGQYSANQRNLFAGLATDEVYLIKAECEARLDKTNECLTTLNTLLEKRWEKGKFQGIQSDSSERLLSMVLSERRKQLMFRGIRWGDLRRLNQETRFETVIRRRFPNIGEEYLLPPRDLRYTFLIPMKVIEFSGMEQNPR